MLINVFNERGFGEDRNQVLSHGDWLHIFFFILLWAIFFLIHYIAQGSIPPHDNFISILLCILTYTLDGLSLFVTILGCYIPHCIVWVPGSCLSLLFFLWIFISLSPCWCIIIIFRMFWLHIYCNPLHIFQCLGSKSSFQLHLHSLFPF